MKNIHNETTGIKTENGNIHAKNITITNNHYGAFSKGFGKLTVINQNKPLKWTIIIVLLAGIAFGTKKTFFNNRISTKEEFLKFLSHYQESVRECKQDAQDQFTNNISVFYKKHNVTPEMVNKERRTSDYLNSQDNIDFSSIILRKVSDIYYWRYKSAVICWRPSLQQFQKCMVEMEFGLDSDNRITSINQLKAWDFIYTEKKPEF